MVSRAHHLQHSALSFIVLTRLQLTLLRTAGAQRNWMGDMSSSGDGTQITVHPGTNTPTKTWDKLKVKQKVEKLTPLSPDTPIREDHIRFVCISDTHTQLEKRPDALDLVPKGDVLLHGGDFSNVGMPKDIKEFNDFLGQLPHTLKVVIAGNHDLSMDMEMVRDQRQYLARQFSLKEKVLEQYLKEAGVDSSRQLLTNCVYLEDNAIDVCGIKIHGSPWQPEFYGWGFNLDRGGPLLEKWNLIPENTDILITHGPPIGHGDMCHNQIRAGCVELLSTIQKRVKPLYHIFGHIHEGYGVTSDGYTTYINASTCTLRYKATNPPIVFDFPIPDGHSKEELHTIPKCNLSPEQGH